MSSFLAYEPTFNGGIYVAAGDFNGDGRADLLLSKATGEVADPLIFDGLTQSVLDHYLSRNSNFRSRALWS